MCNRCRNRKMLHNKCLFAKVGFDTTENEPLKFWRILRYWAPAGGYRDTKLLAGGYRDTKLPSCLDKQPCKQSRKRSTHSTKASCSCGDLSQRNSKNSCGVRNSRLLTRFQNYLRNLGIFEHLTQRLPEKNVTCSKYFQQMLKLDQIRSSVVPS